MAVRPMAGTARTAPAITPLTTSWVTSTRIGGIVISGASEDFQEDDLALVDPTVTEPAVQDVADLVEVAGTAGALVVDLLARAQDLEPLDGAEHLDPRALGDLAHVVAD